MNVQTTARDGRAHRAAAAEVARRLQKPSLRPASVSVLALCVDLFAVSLALWWTQLAHASGEGGAVSALLVAVASAVTTSVSLVACRGYRLPGLRRLWRSWAALAVTSALVASVGLVGGLWTSWLALVTPAALALPARALVSKVTGWVLDYGLTDRRAAIVGGGEEAERLIHGLAGKNDSDIRIIGLFDDRDDMRSPPVVVGTPKLGSVAELIAFARAAEVDMLILALPLTAERRIREVLQQVRVLPVDVRLSAYSADFSFPRRGDAEGLIAVIRRPLEGWRWLAKRGLDVLGATAALVVLSPVMLLTALAIKIDTRGPVLFRQKRHGYNNRSIDILKFRSMHVEASDPTARRLVQKDDPRVTRVGRFIRRWSIDELPQLVNVLRGELSLVGPRPHVLDAVSSERRAFEEIVEGYAARHRVPPGLTGWAQISGCRGEIDRPEKLEARVERDLYYIENWSIWLDLRILLLTPFRLLDKRGAY